MAARLRRSVALPKTRTIPHSGIVFRATLCFRLTRAPLRGRGRAASLQMFMRFQPAESRIRLRAHRPSHHVQTFRRLRAEIVRQLGSLPLPALPIALRFSPPNIVSCRLIRSFGLRVPPTAINPDFALTLWTWWTKWTSHSCPQSPLLSTGYFLSMSTYSASITPSSFFCSCPDDAPSPAAPAPACGPPLG